MSKTNQELFEKAIQIINKDIDIYDKLNTTQFDKGLDLFEIYSECYDINVLTNNNIQRTLTYTNQESKNIKENEKESQKNDALIQLQIFVKQIQNQQSRDTKYQKIIAITNELICFLEQNSDFYKKFQIQSDQLIYLRIFGQDPIQSLILKSGLNLLNEWLVAMLYKFKIHKNIEFETKTQARLLYQSNVLLEFILYKKDSIVKNKKECYQKIKETLLAEQLIMTEILSEGFALSKLTEYLVGQLQGGFCGIEEWVKRVIQISNLRLNGQLNTYDKK
ncbi:unnamed protein product [Paramecium pentaurelia]|uniref:Uncharacterized protein n=1 Tax=Paramecium pentaurelia TaxID=43138 RepID=A0A8S1TXK2_9CILI|nr:unnamed protein product [Paramecium pentaurelia]